MRRTLAVAVAAILAGSVLVPTVLATAGSAAQASGATAIDGCTNITSPGEYELAGDVEGNASSDCIEIRSSDVTLDGNGHTVAGPGPDAREDNAVYRGIYVTRNDGDETVDDVVVRNVEVAGWDPGIRTDGAEVTIEHSVVRDNGDGIRLEETGATDLSNVTVRENDATGVDTDRIGDVEGVDVTISGNNVGLQTWDSHGIDLEDSRIEDNDRNGVNVHHHSTLNLTDSVVEGNGEDGINARTSGGFHVDLSVDGGTVSNNGAAGVVAIGSVTVDLEGVSLSRTTMGWSCPAPLGMVPRGHRTSAPATSTSARRPPRPSIASRSTSNPSTRTNYRPSLTARLRPATASTSPDRSRARSTSHSTRGATSRAPTSSDSTVATGRSSRRTSP
jgi:hypothetical protein